MPLALTWFRNVAISCASHEISQRPQLQEQRPERDALEGDARLLELLAQSVAKHAFALLPAVGLDQPRPVLLVDVALPADALGVPSPSLLAGGPAGPGRGVRCRCRGPGGRSPAGTGDATGWRSRPDRAARS